MKRTMTVLLVIIALAVWLGTLAARDPGYVLVSYDGATVQSGLWVMLALVTAAIFSTYYTIRLFAAGFSMTGKVQRWSQTRKKNRSTNQTGRGLIYLQEGNYARAEKFLVSGAQHHDVSAVNYIAAARTAEARGDAEKRESYLRLALEADPQANLAIGVTAAEMALERGEYQQAIALVNELPQNQRSLKIKRKALFGLNEWESLQSLIPALKKVGDADVDLLERDVMIQVLRLHHKTSIEKLKLYKKASALIRSDLSVVLELVKWTQDESELEPLLRQYINASWQSQVVEKYADMGSATAQRRLKAANKWLKLHDGDGALYYCIGKLSESLGKQDEAQIAYQKGVELGNRQATKSLANLLAFKGDFEKSNEYYRTVLD
ncbi:MAG: heme biosynthesis HemY N-terminal domain-containing protein [Pseudomonadales bacterium]|nr:heme biosynthesis HemY N-terminal domain-containing protein [Pseudomonadales bacterium]MDG1442643.1 heme biosynthesis HemY N-terminal domain-containing protein [Pseudomonadales bacterium]